MQPVNKWPQKLKVFLPSSCSAPGAVSWGGSSWRWRGRCIPPDRRRPPHGWPPDREVSTYQHSNIATLSLSTLQLQHGVNTAAGDSPCSWRCSHRPQCRGPCSSSCCRRGVSCSDCPARTPRSSGSCGSRGGSGRSAPWAARTRGPAGRQPPHRPQSLGTSSSWRLICCDAIY